MLKAQFLFSVQLVKHDHGFAHAHVQLLFENVHFECVLQNALDMFRVSALVFECWFECVCVDYPCVIHGSHGVFIHPWSTTAVHILTRCKDTHGGSRPLPSMVVVALVL